ncbi:hypothetical protein GURASL_13240 [Geotalea uraniireducens]|uniref:HTH cro/C1-type domain-containing protein n=1 Tax=Geotalea uraniireducens TaxID=351604 RepID=A0ABM8EIS9_9BACT|nr:helix-turn-helix transcriptional regulator [Geotalea uraniireducens]BDV42401.1 hypothetical protein GURASL_13240 [Geotalea uraniireducens]
MNSDAFKDRLKTIMGDESNRSFAEKCGISEGTLRRYLRGDTTPDLETLHAIADVGGCTLAWLAAGQGPMRRGEGGQLAEEKERRYVIDPSAELMAQVQERLNACIVKYGATLSVEKTINLTMTSMRIFDGNYKDREFRELMMDSVIDNLVRLALPEK